MRTRFSCRLPRLVTAADFGRLLLLLLLVARAWVPVGYMPDADALRQGRLALGFCAAGGGAMPHFSAERGADASALISTHDGPHAILDASSDGSAHTHSHAAQHANPNANAHTSHSDHQHETGAGQECPFGLSAHQVLQVPSAPALAPVLLRWLAQVPPQTDRPRPPMPAAGPPLGQRAPPSILE